MHIIRTPHTHRNVHCAIKAPGLNKEHSTHRGCNRDPHGTHTSGFEALGQLLGARKHAQTPQCLRAGTEQRLGREKTEECKHAPKPMPALWTLCGLLAPLLAFDLPWYFRVHRVVLGGHGLPLHALGPFLPAFSLFHRHLASVTRISPFPPA